MSALLEAALNYAQFGWHVFPCSPQTKRPLTEHGFKDASIDSAAIKAWWGKWPSAMIGVATGASGLVVLDVDVDPAKGLDGEASLAALLNGSPLPADATVARTPRGGKHFYFTARDDLVVHNTAGKLGHGLDTRGEGGYVIAAPSVNGDGIAYRWEPWGVLHPAPDWLVPPRRPESIQPVQPPAQESRGRDRRGYGEAALRQECDRVAAATPGERNATLFKAAASLFELVAGRELDEGEARSALIAAAHACGLTDREIGPTMESAFKHGSSQPRRAPAKGKPQAKPAAAKPSPPITEARKLVLEQVARAAARSDDPNVRALGEDVAHESATLEAELAALSDLPPLEYERRRTTTAEEMGIRVSVLDSEVARRRGDGRVISTDPPRWEVEPWPDAVDGAELADEIVGVLRRFIVMPEHCAEAIALFVLHAWAIDSAGVSPILALRSPEKRCGKTSLLILLLWLCPRSEASTSISPSAIFRLIEDSKPTLLIDELDNAIQDNRDLLAILNGGHRRSTAVVHRSAGDGANNFRVQRFSVWAPKAIATIRVLPSTLADRSIEIPLKRKRPGEGKVERLVGEDSPQFGQLRAKCLRWATDNAERLRRANPYLPKGLDDRAADNWRPLKCIADELGQIWIQRCWDAAEALSSSRGEDEERGTQLLTDIRIVFASDGAPIFDQCGRPVGKGIHTATLLTELVSMKERPWATYGRGDKPLNDRSLAAVLKHFEIKPGPVSVEGVERRGYRLEDFTDAFSRYLPAIPPDPSVGTSEPRIP